MKRQLIFFVILLMFSLYGCSNTDRPAVSEVNKEISQAIERLSKANSYEYMLSTEDITTYGDKQVISKSNSEQKLIFEPFVRWGKTDSTSIRIDGKQYRTVNEGYYVADNNQLDFYLRFSSQEEPNSEKESVLGNWEKNSTTDKDQIDWTIKMVRSNLDAQFYLLKSNIDSFQMSEELERQDVNIVRYDGYIEPATVLEAYKLYLRDFYVQMKMLPNLENPSHEELRSEIINGEHPELQFGISKLAYSEELIPVSLWINKNNTSIEKVVIDESSVLQSLLKIETPKIDLDLEEPIVSKSLTTYEIRGIDTLKEIPMPE